MKILVAIDTLDRYSHVELKVNLLGTLGQREALQRRLGRTLAWTEQHEHGCDRPARDHEDKSGPEQTGALA